MKRARALTFLAFITPLAASVTGCDAQEPSPVGSRNGSQSTVSGSGDQDPLGAGGSDPGGAGGGTAGPSPVSPPSAGNPSGGGGLSAADGVARDGELGTNWHPDPDGDGVLTGTDACPGIYDPQNRATVCDPAVDAPRAGSPIDDLRAEHVTPYGGWFTFRSNENNEYGYYAEIAWSETPNGVGTAAGFAAAVAKGDTARVRVNERLGDRIPMPIVVTSMKPGTTYSVATRDNGGRIGKVQTITTLAAPALARPTTFPRVYATTALTADLRARNTSGDASFVKWKNQLAPKIDRALSGSDIEDEKYCNAAALLWHATGDAAMLGKAKQLHTKLLTRWEAGPFTGNAYRWADAALAVCTDLLWNDLDAATHERAIRATLPGDEHAAFEPSDFRLDDTDEAQSSIRTWLIDGLLGCGAPGVAQDASDRACKVLDAGMRYWHGYMLVQARRDKGYMAMSGGHMPDSTRYAQGSSTYWLQSFWAMKNQGFPVADYAPWIVHNLLATYLQATTPRNLGTTTYGDIDRYQVPGEPEPNSCAVDTFHFDVLAIQMGLLSAAGRTKEAGWAKKYLDTLGAADNYQSRAHMLMFDTSSITPVDHHVGATAVPTAFVDSGFGLAYDRTSWTAAASMITFRGGWSGVDHSQEEQGHFQLYRRGRWLTHESSAYEGTATHVQGHNVLQLGVLYNHDERRSGQYAFRNEAQSEIVRRSSSPTHSYLHGDYTGAYQSGFTNYFAYDKVQRGLVWLKGDDRGGADVLVVYDLVNDGVGRLATAERNFQLNLDAAPVITGRSAAVEVDGVGARQKLKVDVLLPATASLSAVAPAGAPGNGADAIYTYRLVATPNTQDAKLRYVTVLSAVDATATSPVSTAIDAGAYVGAQVGTTAVLFPRDPIAARAGAASVVTVVVPAGTTKVYLTGLTPDATYALGRAAAAGGGATLTVTPAAGGTVGTADKAGMLVLNM